MKNRFWFIMDDYRIAINVEKIDPIDNLAQEEDSFYNSVELIPIVASSVHDTSSLSPANSSAWIEFKRSFLTVFTIWNSMMGASLLTLPWGMQQSGLAVGLALIFSVGL